MALPLRPLSQRHSSWGASEPGWVAYFLPCFTPSMFYDLGNLCAL